MQQLPLGVRLRERASFEAFLAGDNLQAVARLQAAAAGARGVVWLWGAPGCGRTHLLQAVCGGSAAELRASYLPLADLRAAGPDVLAGADRLDLMCLDDLDQVVGALEFERRLFSVYRDFDERRAGLVVSAAAPPAACRWSLADIGSRFGASEVFQVHPLDEDQQVEALRLRATLRGFDLPEETARYLQRRFTRDMSSLCALLERIDTAALSAQRRVTVPFIRETLGDP